MPGALLVTAHPDDEVMFFTPTLLALCNAGVPIHLLCLSNGNAYGAGNIRQQELRTAWKRLQLDPGKITIINDPRLQDGMQNVWPIEVVSGYITACIDRWQVCAVFTFDGGGVSGHPNHIQTYRGALHAIAQMNTPPKLLILKTQPLWQKYLGLWLAICWYCFGKITHLHSLFDDKQLNPKHTTTVTLPRLQPAAVAQEVDRIGSLLQQKSPGKQLFASYSVALLTGMWSMAAHGSQFVWYRVLFILFSTYTYFNVFVAVN